MAPFATVRLSQAAMIWADQPLVGRVSAQLYDTIQALLEEGAIPIVIDLVRVSAVDDQVVTALAAAASQAGAMGRALELRLVGRRRFTVRDAGQLRSALAHAYPTAA
jgi:anti-anti-sigma regulatory factor